MKKTVMVEIDGGGNASATGMGFPDSLEDALPPGAKVLSSKCIGTWSTDMSGAMSIVTIDTYKVTYEVGDTCDAEKVRAEKQNLKTTKLL